MLTIFTTCKPFTGEQIRIQRNAILSWMNLKPKPEIFIMGNQDEGVQNFADRNNIKVIDIEYNEKGHPYADSMFHNAQKNAENDVVCYTNSDIIHFQCLIEAVKILKNSEFKEYVCTGQRWDLDIDFDLEWDIEMDQKLYKLIDQKGLLHSYSGCDYQIFPKNKDWSYMPHFNYGKPYLSVDNWINLDTINKNIPLIDATGYITLIHQNHMERTNDGSYDIDRNHGFIKGHHLGCNVAPYILSHGVILERNKAKVIIE